MSSSKEDKCDSHSEGEAQERSSAWAIPLGADGRYDAIVSEEDYEYLRQWAWSFKISDHKHGLRIYARRGGGRGNRKSRETAPTILMHDVVCERACGPRPSTVHTADHKNRKSLDNRRSNLQWATRKEQRANQGKRKRWFNRSQGNS